MCGKKKKHIHFDLGNMQGSDHYSKFITFKVI